MFSEILLYAIDTSVFVFLNVFENILENKALQTIEYFYDNKPVWESEIYGLEQHGFIF